MGITPAGHVTAGAIDRNDALAEPDAGFGLHLELLQAVALGLRKAAHLVVGEADIVLLALADLGDQPFLLLVA